MTDSTQERLDWLTAATAKAIASFSVLFQEPQGEQRVTRTVVHKELLDAYRALLAAIDRELRQVPEDPASARLYADILDGAPDSIDYLNFLIRQSGRRPFAELLKESVWDVVRDRLPQGGPEENNGADAQLHHTIGHAARVFELGVRIPQEYFALVGKCADVRDGDAPSRLDPTGLGSLEAEFALLKSAEGHLDPAMLEKIRALIKAQDDFSGSRTFRAHGSTIRPFSLGEIRTHEDFYGYKIEKRFFETHMTAFAEGKKVQPLLVSGLPGLGKTHMTIASTLSFPDFTLVNAGLEEIERHIEAIMAALGRYHYRKFVLFFDDLDPRKVDWGSFRHQVDGYLPRPRNVLMVIASNTAFPARVLSRCHAMTFRPMACTICREMITDYLRKHRWMSQPYPNLVSTVSADYVNQYTNGPLNELTPRSMVRYFETLEPNRDKIRRLIRDSLEDMTHAPTEDPFVESNNRIIKMMEQE